MQERRIVAVVVNTAHDYPFASLKQREPQQWRTFQSITDGTTDGRLIANNSGESRELHGRGCPHDRRSLSRGCYSPFTMKVRNPKRRHLVRRTSTVEMVVIPALFAASTCPLEDTGMPKTNTDRALPVFEPIRLPVVVICSVVEHEHMSTDRMMNAFRI